MGNATHRPMPYDRNHIKGAGFTFYERENLLKMNKAEQERVYLNGHPQLRNQFTGEKISFAKPRTGNANEDKANYAARFEGFDSTDQRRIFGQMGDLANFVSELLLRNKDNKEFLRKYVPRGIFQKMAEDQAFEENTIAADIENSISAELGPGSCDVDEPTTTSQVAKVGASVQPLTNGQIIINICTK